MNRMLLFGCCLLAGCDHAWPYDSSRPGPLGPQSQVVPRRLTFSTGDDRDPAVRGDVLVYSRSNPLGLPAPLNGRALADDVIDVELIVTTGGDPLNLFGPDGSLTGIGPDRNASGAVNGDGVGPHTDYSSTFPYLGTPH